MVQIGLTQHVLLVVESRLGPADNYARGCELRGEILLFNGKEKEIPCIETGVRHFGRYQRVDFYVVSNRLKSSLFKRSSSRS